MSGYYDKKLGYYTFVNGVSTQNSGPHHLGFHLHLSTRGDSLDHLHGFSDSIDDVISKWSGEPAFNHLTANDIREGIEAIQFRSHPNFAQDDGANLKGYERAATIEQLYGVAKLAAAISHTNEQDVQNTKTSLWALRADLDRLHATQTNLTAHIPPLQNNTTNLKAAAQFLNHRLNTLDATSHNLATTTTLLEQNLIHTTTELTQSQTQIADLQRAVQGMVQQIELLSTIARQNADVTEAKNQRIEELIQAAARDRGNLVELKDLLRMAREEKRAGTGGGLLGPLRGFLGIFWTGRCMLRWRKRRTRRSRIVQERGEGSGLPPGVLAGAFSFIYFFLLCYTVSAV